MVRITQLTDVPDERQVIVSPEILLSFSSLSSTSEQRRNLKESRNRAFAS